MTQDIVRAREYFEKAEREADPGLKARALEEALSVLASLDDDEISDSERTLIANLRLAHTRRLLVQLVGLESAGIDAWLEYVHLLFGELRPEVERLIEKDAGLRDNYARFTGMFGSQLAEILEKQNRDAS
jgi:hypothetical protein